MEPAIGGDLLLRVAEIQEQQINRGWGGPRSRRALVLDLGGVAQLIGHGLEVVCRGRGLAAHHQHAGGLTPFDQHLSHRQLGPPDGWRQLWGDQAEAGGHLNGRMGL